MRNDIITGMAEIAPRQNGSCMHRHGLHDDHAGTAHRPLPVIGDVLFPRQAIHGHVCSMGTEYDPVLQRLVAQLNRCEDMFEGHHISLTSRNAS